MELSSAPFGIFVSDAPEPLNSVAVTIPETIMLPPILTFPSVSTLTSSDPPPSLLKPLGLKSSRNASCPRY